MRVLEILAADGGWKVSGAGAPQFFASGKEAERAARGWAQELAEDGEAASLRISDRSGGLIAELKFGEAHTCANAISPVRRRVRPRRRPLAQSARRSSISPA